MPASPATPPAGIELVEDEETVVAPEQKELSRMIRNLNPVDKILKKFNISRKVNVLQYEEFAQAIPATAFPDSAFWNEGECHEIGVRFVVFDVTNVNTVENYFETNVRVTLDWKPSRAEVHAICNTRAYTVNENLLEFRPALEARCIDSSEVDAWSSPELTYNPEHEEFTLKSCMRSKFTFQENFELQNFPMDVQDLSMVFAGPSGKLNTVEHLEFHPYGMDGNKWVKVELQGIEEADFQFKTAIAEFQVSDPAGSRYGRSYSRVVIRLKIQRRWEHYFYRLCAVLSLVTLTGSMGFTMDLDSDFPDACSFMGTSLLTVVAFMFVVQSTLPAIPYLTFLDYFVYSMLVFVVIQMSGLALYAFDFGVEERKMFCASILLWTLIHIFFGIAAHQKKNKEKKKLNMSGKEIHDMFYSGSKGGFYLVKDKSCKADYVGFY